MIPFWTISRWALMKVEVPAVGKPIVKHWVTHVTEDGKVGGYTTDHRLAGAFRRAQILESCIGGLVRDHTHDAIKWEEAGKADPQKLDAWDGYTGED